MNAYLTFPACHRKGGVERIMVECANFLATRDHGVSVLSGEFDPTVLDPRVKQCLVPVRHSRPLLRLNSYRHASRKMLTSLRQAAAPAKSVHAAFGVVCPTEGVLWVQSVHAEWIKIAQSSRSFAGRLKQRLNPFHPFILHLEKKYYREKLYRKLIALTPRVRAELMEHYNVPPGDIVLIPNGYNPAEFNPARRADREKMRIELGFAEGDKVLVFVANELERKGFFPLLDAISSLKNPQVKLLVVGRVFGDSQRDLIARLGLTHQVQFTGPSADVARFYAAADLFVLPTYYEAWGLVIVEALASGIPVLTSRLAGAAAAVQEDYTGMLLDDPRDPAEISVKIDALLHMQTPTPELISRTVESYQWPRLLLTYESLLAEQCA